MLERLRVRGLVALTVERPQSAGVRGWDVFDSDKYGFCVQRDDECKSFPNDGYALEAAVAFFDAHAPR